MKWLLLAGVFVLGCSNQRPLNILNTSSVARLNIVGGTDVSASDSIAASVVQVYKVAASDQTISTCTGNVIASHIVLTAAHCVAGAGETNYIYFSRSIPADIFKFFQVQMAASNLRGVIDNVIADQWIANDTRPEKDWHDLALLKFTGELPAGYRVVVLNNDLPVNQEPALIAGFGMIDGLHEVHSSNLQQTTIPVLDAQWSSTEILLDSSHGKASCHGDSGGPAYVIRNGRLSLVGIDSRSELNSDPNFDCTGYTIYTRIGAYLDWISTQVRRMN